MDKKVLHQVFEQVALNFPEKVAIESDDKWITYHELNSFANRLAHLLCVAGVEKGTIVNVVIPPSVELVSALLSVFKCGSVYLPVDLSFSARRLRQIFTDTFEGVVVLTAGQLEAFVSLSKEWELNTRILIVIGPDASLSLYRHQAGALLETPAGELSEWSANLSIEIDGNDSNYIFYTSGSTGEGKAILGAHSSLSHFIHWEIKEFGIDGSFRVSQLIQATFDASLRDIFVPLIAGATLCIPAADTRNNPARLLEWLETAGISLLHCVPSLFRVLTKEWQSELLNQRPSETPNQLPSELRPGHDFSRLKYILMAGELLYVKDITNWRSLAGEDTGLVNLYGATETTMIRMFYRINAVPDNPAQLIPVGIPISNTTVAVIKDGTICKAGEIGEVYIKTPFASKGYYNDSRLTEECFVQNPLQQGLTDIVYKTGDLGRYLTDGNIEVLGRLDTQVKVNGIRVELVEIEQAILRQDGITGAVVRTHRTDDNMVLLVAYYTGKKIDETQLRDSLAADLNQQIIPSMFIHLDEFPLTINGKIDKKALPIPEDAFMEGANLEMPVGTTENSLALLWQDILGLKRIGRDISFFNAGGHSLRAIQLVSAIKRQFGIDIRLADIFAHRTIRGQAALLTNSPAGKYIPIRQAELQPHYPLSSSQHRLWILSQLEEANIAYNIQDAYLIKGNLDRPALEHAFAALTERHEILRTIFKQDEQGRIRQFIQPEAGLSLSWHDLRESSRQEEEAGSLLRQERAKPFDLSAAPLFRTTLFRLKDNEWILSFTMHHIINDAWSMEVMMRELALFYNESTRGEKSPLLPLRIQYRDYASWQQEQLNGEALGQHRQYWLSRFAGDIPVLELPEDKPRPAVKSNKGAVVNMTIDTRLYLGIKSLCEAREATLFMGLLALVNALLYRYTQQEDIIIGCPIAGREHPDLEGQIGFYVNMLAMRTQFNGGASFAGLLDAVKQVTLGAYEHQQYPFDELVGELRLQRDISRNPLFDVVLLLRNYERNNSLIAPYPGGIEVGRYDNGDSQSSKFDLKFTFSEEADRLQAAIEFNSDIYHQSTMDAMGLHLQHLLAAIVEQPAMPVWELDYLEESEKKVLLTDFNDTAITWPKDKTIVDLFEAQVRTAPDNPALVFEKMTFTYRELNEVSNQLAGYLREGHGIRADDRIGISLPRSERFIIAILGTLKSGGAYVPIDTAYPQERIGYMLSDSGCKVLIDEEEWNKFLRESHRYGRQDLGSVNHPDDLAYVMYTSGSRGVPKGVMVEHAAVIRLVRPASYVSISSTDSFLSVASFSFDGSVFDIFAPLLNGAALIISLREQFLDPWSLARTIKEKKISVAFFPTALFNSLVEAGRLDLGDLRYVVVGGEALSLSHAKRFREYYGRIGLINGYGPTENTTFSTFYPVREIDASAVSLPIGKPLSNSSCYILNERDHRYQLAPIGVAGEICVGGAGLSRGYLNKPELTAEKFVANPFREGEQMYKTGDWGRWLPDGNIAFLGRKDDQVKIRGYRIELEEIENTLRNYPRICSATILARPVAEGEKELVAYLVSSETLDMQDVKTYAGRLLPQYMIPSHFMQLPALPITHNGKIDRKQLPDPEGAGMDRTTIYMAPRTEAERHLVEVCEEVLRKRPIGIKDDIFSLGGDSIKSIQIVSRLKQRGYVLTIKDILSQPVIEDLATRITPVGRLIDQGPVEGFVPLGPVQSWFLQDGSPGKHHFNQSVLLISGQPIDQAALTAVLDKLVSHHDALRMVFRHTADGWIQENRGETQRYSLEVIAGTDEKSFPAHCDRLQTSMDLVNGPLFKVALFKGNTEDRLLLVAHHLVIDGVSWRILFEDLSTLYLQYQEGQPLQLPEKTDSFRYWLEQQEQYARSADLRSEEAYWSAIESVPVRPLPVDNPQGGNLVKNTASISFSLDETSTDRLLTQCNRAYNTDINDILLTSFSLALTQLFGLDRISITLEGHGREPIVPDVDVMRTVGWFTTQYPVVFDMRYKEDCIRQLVAIKENLHTVPNKGIGYGTLKYFAKKPFCLRPDITFNYLGDFGFSPVAEQGKKLFDFSGEYRGNEVSGERHRSALLDVTGMVVMGTMQISVFYSGERYAARTIERLTAAFKASLEELIRKLSAERQVILSPSDLTYKGLSMEQLEKLNKLVC